MGLPNLVSQGSGYRLGGQNCYIEVTLGFPNVGNDKALNLDPHLNANSSKHHTAESAELARGVQRGSPNYSSICEKTFIYPTEAVLVPVLQTSFARASLKRYIFVFCGNYYCDLCVHM